jgi:hypothetical protein
MTRKFKALGIAVFAVLAMSAIVSSAASAASFTAASYPVTYAGNQAPTEPHVFKADTFETTCKNAEFKGTANEASSTATLTPTYSECTAAGLEATIDMNGCSYVFHITTTTATDWDSTVDVSCPAGKDITITAGFGACVIHVPAQTGKSNVTLKNAHPNIRGEANVTGLTAHLTDVSSFLCPFNGSTNTTTASFTGNLTIEGSSTLNID